MMNGEQIRNALEATVKIEDQARRIAQATLKYGQETTHHREALERITADASRVAQVYADLADAAAAQADRFRAMLQDLERGLCPCCGQPTGDNGRMADLGGFGLLQ
jgi:iron-sulfur cluster repair protein YtfE (RIC family)